VPDGQFVAWLGQVQWARRYNVGFLDAQSIVRVDAQLSNNPLLGLEQFAVGGRYTVRGYRENELVRDQGVVASLEIRVPVWKRSTGVPIVELAPFVDYGYSDNKGGSRFGDNSTGSDEDELVSVGIGVRWTITDWARAEMYWGQELNNIHRGDIESDPQDKGFFFQITAELPEELPFNL
jgi:hemolysin activation/secretion protein